MQLCATVDQIAAQFKVKTFGGDQWCGPAEVISGFEHRAHPIITNSKPGFLSPDYRWGLVPPDWKKPPEAIWNHTISAKLEYINRRYSWQKVAVNRCLIPATAYFEYHWNDVRGKSKTRFTITSRESAIFALAGLYAECIQKGTVWRTFAVCTTQANQTMQFVHNKDEAKNYSRMPVMLKRGDEFRWLDPRVDHLEFGFPDYSPELIARPESGGLQPSLFEDLL